MSKSPGTSNKQSNELRILSNKLNLEIDKNDNIHLYSYIADWLGIPHKLGSCTKEAIDCSCFIMLLYKNIYNKSIPRTAMEMYKACSLVDLDKLEEGNLVFFKIKSNKVSHVGIYLKKGWFAHVSTSRGVMINSLDEAYYKQYFIGGGQPN
ncbi:MAG: NlpC/P60 family protein [Bacteroidia bacterium]|nr:NlpC/P60 family protein [Bacteroidia bacterium]